MSATLILINLAGDVGILLWGTYMVTSGVLRGYGTDMRRWLGRSLDGRIRAFMAGLVVTGILQSSTATSLMAPFIRNQRLHRFSDGLVGNAQRQRRYNTDRAGAFF